MEAHKRVRVVLDQKGQKSRTHQSMSDACDINKILGRFRTTGFITHTNLRRPVYEDFGSTESYQDAMNKIRRAEAVFAALPARVRQRVNNDPAQLIDFVENPENDEELIELGLKNKPSATPLAAATEAGTEKETEKKKEPPITNVEGP